MSRHITSQDLDNARRLKALWNREKAQRRFTQTSACDAMGIADQSTISQYLNGHIALNCEATLRFAKFLKVRPEDIDPGIAKWMPEDRLIQATIPLHGKLQWNDEIGKMELV